MQFTTEKQLPSTLENRVSRTTEAFDQSPKNKLQQQAKASGSEWTDGESPGNRMEIEAEHGYGKNPQKQAAQTQNTARETHPKQWVAGCHFFLKQLNALEATANQLEINQDSSLDFTTQGPLEITCENYGRTMKKNDFGSC